jgi:dTDP-glucose 4,6-dehydratase
LLDTMGLSGTLVRHVMERPGQVARHISSTAKAKTLLDWEATTSLEEGLRRTIELYADNREWWRTQDWMKLVPIRTETGCIEYH